MYFWIRPTPFSLFCSAFKLLRKGESETTTMKTKLIQLALSMTVLLTAIFIHSCEGVGVDIPHCTIPVNLEVLGAWGSVAGQNTGTITVEATRGNGGYEYSLNEGPFQSSGEFVNLPGGDYTIDVRDRQGCTNSITLTLDEVEIPSFANDIMPIMENFCSITFCHRTSGAAPFEIEDYNDVFPRIIPIRIRVTERTMPPFRRTRLSDEQISTIVYWIDGGAPNN